MRLSKDLQPAFEQAMLDLEQEHKVTYVTSIERSGIERGMAIGLEKGLHKGKVEGQALLLERLLIRKFGVLPSPLKQRLQAATPAQLETWSLNILDANTLDQVFTE